MASIRKRGSKWQVQIRRQVHRSATKSFVSKFDADRWARHQEHLADAEAIPSTSDWRSQGSALSLEGLLGRYVSEITTSKRSAASESFHLLQIRRHKIGRVQLQELRSTDIAQFRDDRLRQVSSSTVRKELSILGHVLKVADLEWGFTGLSEIAKGVRKPPSMRPRDRRLQPGEFELLHASIGRVRNPVFKDVVLFAIETAMRRGEILSLTWDQVDFKRQTAHLPITKNGEARTVPLSLEAIRILQKTRTNQCKAGTVFPITANALRLAWGRCVRRAGIENLRFHDLRHEAISRFFELGLSIPEVALISGHKDPRMLFRYTHLKAEAVAQKITGLSS